LIPTGTRFDPDAILELLARARVTNTWMVPTQIVMLTDAISTTAPAFPDLRRVVYGGAPFAPADLKRALELFGPIFVQLFGQGETPMTATVLPASDHAAALDVAVVGIPDRTWGELVVAVVVSDDTHESIEGALSQHCAAVLAGYKRPRRYVFRDSLPRNAYGKVLKRELRDELAGLAQ